MIATFVQLDITVLLAPSSPSHALSALGVTRLDSPLRMNALTVQQAHTASATTRRLRQTSVRLAITVWQVEATFLLSLAQLAHTVCQATTSMDLHSALKAPTSPTRFNHPAILVLWATIVHLKVWRLPSSAQQVSTAPLLDLVALQRPLNAPLVFSLTFKVSLTLLTVKRAPLESTTTH